MFLLKPKKALLRGKGHFRISLLARLASQAAQQRLLLVKLEVFTIVALQVQLAALSAGSVACSRLGTIA